MTTTSANTDLTYHHTNNTVSAGSATAANTATLRLNVPDFGGAQSLEEGCGVAP